MSYFLKTGGCFTVSSKASIDIYEQLPSYNYVLKFDRSKEQFYLEQIELFELPTKLYGDTTNNAHRIIQTFLDRPNTTGVLLAGEKGSGKTLLAKMISVEGLKLNIPTIIINTAFFGDNFNKFIQDIYQPVIILFDEFEKVYHESSDQEAILTLLDGVFPSKKLFVLTCNNKYKINVNMTNRPGRIYYMLNFDGLNQNFIREYSEDNLDDKTQVDSLCKLEIIFTIFNFDMLKAIVEEMNRYKESAQEVLKMLNVKPEFESDSMYIVHFVPLEPNIKMTSIRREISSNPIMKPVVIDYYSNDDKDGNYETYTHVFRPTDLKHIDGNSSRFTYKNSDGLKLILEKKFESKFNYYQAF